MRCHTNKLNLLFVFCCFSSFSLIKCSVKLLLLFIFVSPFHPSAFSIKSFVQRIIFSENCFSCQFNSTIITFYYEFGFFYLCLIVKSAQELLEFFFCVIVILNRHPNISLVQMFIHICLWPSFICVYDLYWSEKEREEKKNDFILKHAQFISNRSIPKLIAAIGNFLYACLSYWIRCDWLCFVLYVGMR